MTDQSLQIYIRGFPKTTKESDLKTLFEKFGPIKQARIINAYAFIGFQNQDSVKQSVKEMNQFPFQGSKLKVEVAGKPKKQKGPQPNDQCRFCKKLGHWKNSCPQYRKNYKDRDDRRRRRSSSSSSSSSSDRHRKKRSRRKRDSSSQSDSSNSSSSSSSSRRYQSEQLSRDRKQKKKVKKQKTQNGKKQEEIKY